jgi:signal transduction histidine kinase
MKNDGDPRFPVDADPHRPDARDTRLDPIEDLADSTQRVSIVPPPAAADHVLPSSRRPVSPVPAVTHQPGLTGPPLRPTPSETNEVLFSGLESLGTPSGGIEAFLPSDSVPSIGEAFRVRAPRQRTGWAFLPLAPLLVVVVGLAVALGIGLVGLDQLSRAGDEHAAARAELIAATVAARLGALPASRRLDAAQLAARRSAAELLVVTPAGEIIHDQTLGAPDPVALKSMLATGHGVAQTRMGRARYAVHPIGPRAEASAPRLVVLVPEPGARASEAALASALAALAVLLLGVAAGVAYAVSRDVTRDVDFVTDRVRTMAQVRTEPTGELIPARTMDEVGVLTSAFNALVGRFGIASSAYRGDLARASSADRERAAFLAAVSHELRSPLNAILGFADILMEEVDGPLSPSAKEEVEQIRGSGAHLLALINDILEFSALESGQLRLTRGRVDVSALANEVIREARGLVGDKPIVVRIEAEPVIARVDGRRVRQVLGNLVNNAIKFTQQGEVVVQVRREGTMAAFLVTDTGPGISEQERAVIFEEYKQARSERLRRRGTGLGLAIARRLVMLHHGSISVDSELERGSTFKVMLPIGNIDAPPSRTLSRPPGAHLANNRRPGGPTGAS